MEWKFSRAVVADEYRRYHPIVVPFNIITYPVAHWYINSHGDTRDEVCRRTQYTLNRSVVADEYVLRQNLHSAYNFLTLVDPQFPLSPIPNS